MALITCKECGEEISKKATKCPKCGSPAKKKTSLVTWLVTILGVLWLVGYYSGNSGTSGTASSKYEPSPNEVAMKNVELDFSWNKAGFDSIMKADFIINNKSKYQIKDIQITCTHYAKSGTKVDSNERIIFDVVPAKSKSTFKDFNMGFMHSQAEKTGCKITDLKI